MSENKTVQDVIKSITSNRESGRLEINSSGMYGTLLFSEGKLVDARLESLSGFQAVNAVVSLRDVQFSFDHVPPASHVSTITASERVVLKQFFGIEAAEMDLSAHAAPDPDPDWNATPEQVVPLAEVSSGTVATARRASFMSGPRLALAVGLVLLVALTIGALVLRSKLNAPPQSAAVDPTVGSPVESLSTPADVALGDSGERDANVQDLTGEWRVINTVKKTAYKSFGNMQVGFRLVIDQRGKEFTARGEKFSENGQTLPVGSRTPIRVTGSIDGDKVVATFVEDGQLRRTNGRFVWRVERDGLAGTFVSSAANSSGRSAVTKEQ